MQTREVESDPACNLLKHSKLSGGGIRRAPNNYVCMHVYTVRKGREARERGGLYISGKFSIFRNTFSNFVEIKHRVIIVGVTLDVLVIVVVLESFGRELESFQCEREVSFNCRSYARTSETKLQLLCQ